MTMVMSAETACFPQNMAWRFRENASLESRRVAVSKAVENLTADWVRPWAPCADKKVAPCDSQPAYRYPNWGWVMGPVKSLKPLFEFVYHGGARHELDQERAEWWLYTNQDKITLDYAGAMVLSTHQMIHGRPDDQAPLELKMNKRGQPWILNKITGEPCCFAHGNGNGEGFINRMMERMNNLTGAY